MSTESGVRDIHREEVRASIVIAGVVALGLTIVANLIIRLIGMQIATIPEGFDPLASAYPTIIVSAIYTIGAVVTYAIVLMVSKTPVRTFLIIAAVAFVLSFVPTILQHASNEESTTAGVAILSTMHVVSALIIVPTLLRIGR